MRDFAYFLSLVLVFSIPWENSVIIVSVGTLSRMIGVFATAIWFLSIFSVKKLHKPHLFHIILFVFVLWNIATTFWSIDLDDTIIRIKTYIQLYIMTLLFWDLYITPKSIKKALQAFIFGGYVSIISTFYNFIMYKDIGVRFTASGFNPNDLSLILALGIPMAWHLCGTESMEFKNKLLRIINLIYIPSSFLVIILTASRGSLLAATPSLFYIFWSLRRLSNFSRLLIPVTIIVVIYLFFPLIPQSNIERLLTTSESISQHDLGGRVSIWIATLGYFAKHPVLGVGSGVLSAHNAFLSVLAETGLVGFTFFSAIIAISFYEAFKVFKHQDSLWITVLVILILGACVHTWEDRKPTWLLLSFIIISGNLINNYKNAQIEHIYI